MAIKIYGDKIVFPDNSEQTTAPDPADTSYTKEEIDAQQDAQDVKIDKNTSDLTNVYTKTEVDDSQSAQDVEIAKKIDDAPEDSKTYARNNKTWVNISDTSGIPDAPVDGVMYGRKDGEWDAVADAGDVYTKTETNDLLDEKADKSTTYTKTEVDASQDAQDSLIQANADAIANLPTPVDTYTKAEIDDQQNAQDVEIAKKANTDDTYTKTQTDTLLDSKANVGDSYLKTESYSSVETDSKLFEKADKATTYTKTEVDASQDAQNVNISGNTSAIGTLSGRVSANEQDIATLQDGIFFSSSYSADYPDNPNRDPQAGNMYMQDLSSFTYSYADANQVFLSKTDEQGNVRQFTAVKPNDTIVLNQVESPNYGRYKVISVADVGDYVNLVVEFQIGEGTLLEGDTVALQAFPASAGGSSGIPEAPIDGKQYARQDEAWTEVTGGSTPTPEALVWEDKTSDRALSTVYTNSNEVPIYLYINTTYTATPPENSAYVQLYVDGVKFGTEGLGVTETNVGSSLYQTTMHLIPAGSTYELRVTNPSKVNLFAWREARMPLAVGTGGGNSGSGTKLQVKSSKNSTRTTQTNTGVYEDTGLEVKITPASADNQVWLSFSAGLGNTSSSANNSVRLVRNSDELVEYKRVSFNGAGHSNSQQSFQFLDTPNSTTELTYKLQTKTDNGELRFNDTDSGNASTSTATAIEIGDVSSGGGYTPEAMVWEDVSANRELDTEYTNTNDVPIYVTIAHFGQGVGTFTIDGNRVGRAGKAEGGYFTETYVVPANSVYKFALFTGTVTLDKWHEARMPVAVGTGGETHWVQQGNDLAYVSPNTDSGVFINSQESKNINIVGYNGAEANDLWLRSGGSPNSGLGIKTDGTIQFKNNTGIQFAKDGAENFGAINLNGSGGTSSSLGFVCNDYEGFWLDGQGRFRSPSIRDNTTVSPANIYINPDNGQIERSTSSLYTAEEVDKKLAIKDKLIEKLSARLDELEKKVK